MARALQKKWFLRNVLIPVQLLVAAVRGCFHCLERSAADQCRSHCVQQGGSAPAVEMNWIKIASWLKTLSGSVLFCVENAEEPLRASVAQVRAFLPADQPICTIPHPHKPRKVHIGRVELSGMPWKVSANNSIVAT